MSLILKLWAYLFCFLHSALEVSWAGSSPEVVSFLASPAKSLEFSCGKALVFWAKRAVASCFLTFLPPPPPPRKLHGRWDVILLGTDNRVPAPWSWQLCRAAYWVDPRWWKHFISEREWANAEAKRSQKHSCVFGGSRWVFSVSFWVNSSILS